MLNDKISEDEVKGAHLALQDAKLKDDKSAGYDWVPAEAIKNEASWKFLTLTFVLENHSP